MYIQLCLLASLDIYISNKLFSRQVTEFGASGGSNRFKAHIGYISHMATSICNIWIHQIKTINNMNKNKHSKDESIIIRLLWSLTKYCYLFKYLSTNLRHLYPTWVILPHYIPEENLCQPLFLAAIETSGTKARVVDGAKGPSHLG